MKKKILAGFLSLFLLTSILNCNLLVSNEQICAQDMKEFDNCFPTLLLVYPGCVDPSLNTCGIAVVEVAKDICRSRMKNDSCRAHR
ncbi:hypothetical protein EHO98_21245 [Leptospira stimsonii]|uniref:Cys-rich protein n=1 Tax=Leptospira stimsonii TaxID=2202203 RepID=A0ABY2N8X5_9LEPT|nr:hypothetical protein EHO98_21245 [Leptospira stimsonii]TGM18808.1 hypothetical protein EHQ90_05610 [Leptospira stimsonii]